MLTFNYVYFKGFLIAGEAHGRQMFAMPVPFPAGAGTAPMFFVFVLGNGIHPVRSFAFHFKAELPLFCIGEAQRLHYSDFW